MSTTDSIQPIFVFDNPRTCSQLLHRMFASHPQLETAGCHHWVTAAATSGPERMQLRVKQNERTKAADDDLQQQVRAIFGPMGMDFDKETYRVAANRLSQALTARGSEDDKIPFVKEHVACCLKPEVMGELLRTGSVSSPPANPTAITDEEFMSIKRPVFLIRHPALVIPSQWRAQHVHFGFEPDDEGFEFFATQRSTRFLFDQMRDKDPVIIDAEDVVYQSQALCVKLCQLWAIDPSGVRYTWEKASTDKEGQHPGRPYYFGTLDNSTAPIRPEHQAVDVEAEYGKWKLNFGGSVADALRRRVDADMEQYNYLQQFRMQV